MTSLGIITGIFGLLKCLWLLGRQFILDHPHKYRYEFSPIDSIIVLKRPRSLPECISQICLKEAQKKD